MPKEMSRTAADKLLMKYAKDDKKQKLLVCPVCGESVVSATPYEYIKTKRGSELFMHTECIMKGMGFV